MTTRRNATAYSVAGLFFILMIATNPYLPVVHYDFITPEVVQEIPFHLVVSANITHNGKATSASSTFDGQLVVRGKGGVSVNNPLTMYA